MNFTPASGGLSQSNYTASDQNASSAGGSRPIDGASVACPLDKVVQCDITDLVVNGIPGSRSTAYSLKGGSFVPVPAKDPPRAIALTGSSGIDKQAKLQVLGDRPGVTAATKIRVDAYPFASCGASHISVIATGPDGTNIEKYFPQQGSFEFPVSRYESDSLVVSLFERMITIGVSPNCYVISADSCGQRDGGEGVERGGNLTVEVFPADQYQLKVSIPPFRKKTYSRERTITRATTTNTETTATQGHSSTMTGTRDNLRRRETISFSEKDLDRDNPSVVLKRNGQADDASVTINNIIKVLQDVKKAIESIQDALKDWVPQAGFKFEYELSFLSGDLSVACGWKEWTDWRTYYAISVSAQLTLIKFGLTISFGIKVGPALARVEGKIDDSSVEVDNNWEFNHPDKHIGFEAILKVDIPVVLQGRAEADIYVVKISCAAGVRTGLGGTSGFKLSEGKWSYPVDVKWRGIDAFVSSSTPTGGESESVYHLVDEVEIWKEEIKL